MDFPRAVGPEGVAVISEEYRRLNAQAHQDPAYGTAAKLHAALVQEAIDRTGAKTLLDYGCGKGALQALVSGVEYRGYDPCIPGLDAAPEPADVVYCGDVMEHVEPEFVNAVLADVNRLARVAAIFVICCAKGNRSLADGSPAHRSVHRPDWWRHKLKKFGRQEEHPPIATKPEVRIIVWKDND